MISSFLWSAFEIPLAYTMYRTVEMQLQNERTAVGKITKKVVKAWKVMPMTGRNIGFYENMTEIPHIILLHTFYIHLYAR